MQFGVSSYVSVILARTRRAAAQRRRSRSFAVLLLLLAPCASRVAAAGQACEVKLAGKTSISTIAGFVIVSAQIETTPVSLLLDTGAESELVTPEAASALGLQGDPGHVSIMRGTGGASGW